LSLDAAEIDAGHGSDAAPKRGNKVKLLSLADIDRRTRAYQRTAELIAAVETDLGGTEQLSTGERQIVQRAAVTGALIEDLEARWLQGFPIDPALYATLGNAQRRYFETVGLARRAKDATPQDDISNWIEGRLAEKRKPAGESTGAEAAEAPDAGDGASEAPTAFQNGSERAGVAAPAVDGEPERDSDMSALGSPVSSSNEGGGNG
jgi:hypothetical protein